MLLPFCIIFCFIDIILIYLFVVFCKLLISFSKFIPCTCFNNKQERGNVNKTGCGFNSKDNIIIFGIDVWSYHITKIPALILTVINFQRKKENNPSMQLLDSETPDNYEFQIPAPNLLYKNTFRLTFTIQSEASFEGGWGLSPPKEKEKRKKERKKIKEKKKKKKEKGRREL